MDSLLVVKEKLNVLYGRYDIYVNAICKFIVVALALFLVNISFGYSGALGNPAIVLIVALVCMFIPKTGILYITGLFTVLSLCSVSWEYAIILATVILFIMLLYMQFSPEYGYLILLSALACALKMPVLAAVLCGVYVGISALVPLASGCMIYYILSVVPKYMDALAKTEVKSGVSSLKYIATMALLNKTMYLTVISMALIIIMAVIIKKIEIKHPRKVLTVLACVVNLLVLAVGGVIIKASVNMLSLIVGTLISFLLCIFIMFCTENVDYKRTEKVQFEDDDYIYYVKAVPKRVTSEKKKPRRRTVKFDEVE